MAKDAQYRRWIASTRWLRLRRSVLTAHPLCERCAQEGYVSAATEVHHIRPVEDGVTWSDRQTRMFAPSNLRALCHNCHVRTHVEMGRSGRTATRRRHDEQQAEIRRRFFGEEEREPPGGCFSGGGGVAPSLAPTFVKA